MTPLCRVSCFIQEVNYSGESYLSFSTIRSMPVTITSHSTVDFANIKTGIGVPRPICNLEVGHTLRLQ